MPVPGQPTNDPASAERARVVRLCARISGDPDAAEDLAQEVLLRAHLHAGRLSDQAQRGAWLVGIARHVCLDWLRQRRRAALHAAPPRPAGWEPPDPCDLDLELDRAEVVTLLDRSLGLLPAGTRALLVDHYVHELPLTVLGARRGLSGGAVAMRLQRGRDALRDIVLTRFQEDAVELGLVPAGAGPAWQPTPLWCHGCGQRRLRGRFRPDWGLHLECPDCTRGHAVLLYVQGVAPSDGRPVGELFSGVRGFRRAAARVEADWHALLGRGLTGATAHCQWCGSQAGLRIGGPYGDVETVCRSCGRTCGLIGVWGIAAARPEQRAFARAHPRLRGRPTRWVEAAGTRAVVLGFDSLTSADRIEFVYAHEPMVLLAIHGG